MAEPGAELPYFRVGPDRPVSPVVLSVPHAGREYAEALLSASRLPRLTLETLEDRLVDRLIWRAVAAGSAGIVARAPRAEIDLNRDERELDPALIAPPPPLRTLIQSARTRGGLGLIPARIAGAGAIWMHRIRGEELQRRIEQIHRPYHEALAAELRAAHARFGVAILLDCHSMPPRLDGTRGPALVFGDRHGTSIGRDLLDAAIDAAAAHGYSSVCNNPYAGGYVAARHGRPSAGIHALQLEIDRSLYLDAALREPGPGFDDAARLIAGIADALAARAMEAPHAVAAE